MVNYYTLFEIQETADEVAIKKSYRELSKQHHPDMGGSQEKMAEINEAFHVLSDWWRRKQHDDALNQAREPAPVRTQPKSHADFMQHTYARPRPAAAPFVHHVRPVFSWRPVATWCALLVMAVSAMVFAIYGQPISSAAASPITATTQPETPVDTTAKAAEMPADTSLSNSDAVGSTDAAKPTNSDSSVTPSNNSTNQSATDNTQNNQSTSQASQPAEAPCSTGTSSQQADCRLYWLRHGRSPKL
jgi:curved DNA-binding protein CbpA